MISEPNFLIFEGNFGNFLCCGITEQIVLCDLISLGVNHCYKRNYSILGLALPKCFGNYFWLICGGGITEPKLFGNLNLGNPFV